jgi:phosphoglucosamine mutase
MPKELFGTDGVRGTPGQYPLDATTLYWLGRALGDYLRATQAQPRVLIGMDTRESGARIAREIAAGLHAAGATVRFAGVITTPGVACLVRQQQFSAGVVISASHNPYTDNGVKLFAATGMKFPDVVEAAIEQKILEQRERAAAPGGARLKADAALDEEYLAFLRRRVIPGAKLAGMRMVLDCANGAASALGPELFRLLGADVIAIHNQPDGRNINAGCGSLHPESLQRRVTETRAALGVAFDGDADRAIFVSASGKLVNGDGVLLAAARWMKSRGELKGDTVVGTTMANLGLERALAAEGLRLAREPVGDRYVLEGMQRIGANLGGEQSGHIIFLDDAPTGDGLLTALKMACLVALQGPLDQLVAGLKIFPQTIVNVRVRAKPPLESLPEVARVLAEAERALDGAGRIVLRYSGTEPLARVMVEAEHQADVDRWSQALAATIRSALGA